ncbi:MAG: hypothetical protein KAG84_00200 [Bacteroidales bacterium]|nr:hypothetical protein [Bacteroidales bacterium]
MKVTMFNTRKPKQFNLKSRYHNPEEDERKRRLEKSMRKKEDYDFDANEFKEEMKYRWGLHRESKSEFNKSNTSLNKVLLFGLFAAIVIALIWYLNN